MDLESGCLLWPRLSKGLEFDTKPLAADARADVVIVGGGISGAFLAYYLSLHDIETVLVDRRTIGAGSTAASTGLLQYELDTSLIELAGKIGSAPASVAYRASLDALRAFEPLVAELGDCGFRTRPSLYLAAEEKDADDLRAECDARRSLGIDVQFLNRERLQSDFGIARPAGLLSATAAEVDPYRLTLLLMQHAIQRGVRVFTETEIVRYEHANDAVALYTSNGPRIAAKKIIFATGYETTEFCRPRLTRLASTYAFATAPISKFWPERALIWETARPYLYARTTADGRVIVGGGDIEIVDPAKRDELIPRKVEELAKRFNALVPMVKTEPRYAWAGVFASTEDGLPYIGSIPEFPHGVFALGYGGNGITFSLMAARLIADGFLGRKNELAGLFRFDR